MVETSKRDSGEKMSTDYDFNLFYGLPRAQLPLPEMDFEDLNDVEFGEALALKWPHAAVLVKDLQRQTTGQEDPYIDFIGWTLFQFGHHVERDSWPEVPFVINTDMSKNIERPFPLLELGDKRQRFFNLFKKVPELIGYVGLF